MAVRVLALALLTSVLFSCAKHYRAIAPQALTYSDVQSGDDIRYAWRYNVLAESGNKKYARKETKQAIQVLAVQISNTSAEEITVREHARFYIDDRLVLPMEPLQVQQQIRQLGGLYMLWSLFWVYIITCDSFDCSTIPLPVGVVIGIGNMAKAQRANKDFLHELTFNNILDKRIGPGETVTGLIGISSSSMKPIEIRISR